MPILPILEVRWLGRRPYAPVWDEMKALQQQRVAGSGEDTLLLVEHEEVITLGRRRESASHVLAPGDVPVLEVERGGDVTYHGPGQLVGYPVVALRPDERDLGRFLRILEQGLIDALAALGLPGTRQVEGLTGVWTADGRRKLASIGIAVRRWVTYHGFALNVATDLTRFAIIEPCGLDPAMMTSIAAEGGDGEMSRAVAEVGPAVAAALGRSLA